MAAQWGAAGSHACGRCAACDLELRAREDVLLVAGVHTFERKRLLADGVATMRELAERAAPVADVPDALLARLRAQARLQLDQARTGTVSSQIIDPQALAALPTPSPGDIFFDFEGDPMWREPGSQQWGLEYLFGVIEAPVADQPPLFRAFWAHDRGQEKQALADFLAYLAQRRIAHPDLHIYHYAAYEKAALLRLAASEPQTSAELLDQRWQTKLPPALAALAWAGAGRQAASKLMPQAGAYYQRAWKLRDALTPAQRDAAPWSDDTLGWQVRAALRFDGADTQRWTLVSSAVQAMSADEQKDPAWIYWRARALQGAAKEGAEGEADRLAARQMLQAISTQMNFYGKLAHEDLGGTVTLPPKPLALTATEREAAKHNPGFERALLLIAIGLRNEGVREWNFSLRGMDDRQLLAAAQLACDREVWDRCINTSDRTLGEVDMAQRFPMPYRQEVVAQAREIGLDPAYIYGLIRQESRFIMDARSHVGASGLMQIMPATARWTAKKIGLDYRPDMIADRGVNLRLGTAYLKLVLDDAAYNAGPGRPRSWRNGPTMEAAIWAENVPFAETRDYVKKVLSNATYYGALLGQKPVSLKARLGAQIGPRDAGAASENKELP